MNCTQCGGLLRLSTAHGPYLECDHCGSEFPLPDTPSGVDGLVPLGRPTEHHCPRCENGLELAVLDEAPIEHCGHCKGLLLEDQLFAVVVQERRWAYRGPEKVSPFDPAALESRFQCPSCERNMDRHPYNGPGNVVIDSCFGCGWIWLDAGELHRIEQAPGRRAAY